MLSSSSSTGVLMAKTSRDVGNHKGSIACERRDHGYHRSPQTEQRIDHFGAEPRGPATTPNGLCALAAQQLDSVLTMQARDGHKLV